MPKHKFGDFILLKEESYAMKPGIYKFICIDSVEPDFMRVGRPNQNVTSSSLGYIIEASKTVPATVAAITLYGDNNE